MGPNNKFSVRIRLYAIILIILIPFLIVQGISGLMHYNWLLDHELKAQTDFAEVVAFSFSTFINGIGDDLNSLGYLLLSMPIGEDNHLCALVSEIVREHPSIGAMYLTDAQGRVVATSNLDCTMKKYVIDPPDKPSDNLVVGNLAEDGKYITVQRAVYRDNALVAYSIAYIGLDNIESILPAERTDNTTSYGIVDSNGIIIFRNGMPDIALRRLKARSMGTLAALETGVAQGDRKFRAATTNKYHMGVAVPVPEIGWVVFADQEYDTIVMKVLGSMKYNFLVIIITLVISSALAVKLAKSILNPVSTLQNFAGKIAEGNLAIRTNLRGADELAATGEALDRMAQKIEELERARRLFIQVSAHELRNPMTGIKGITALIKRRAAQNDTAQDLVLMLTMVEKETDRLASSLNQILEAFRAQNAAVNGLPYKWQEVNLSRLIQDMCETFRMGHGEVDLGLNLQSGILVMGDQERLEGVFRNVLHNAVKYSPKEKCVTVSLTAQGEHAIVSFRDGGIGIAQEQLELIFDSFIRGDNFHGSDPGGLGLGLFIAKEIVMRHGGTIWAENNQGKGATFFIKLPLCSERV